MYKWITVIITVIVLVFAAKCAYTQQLSNTTLQLSNTTFKFGKSNAWAELFKQKIDTTKNFVEELNKELNLTPQQQAKIKDISAAAKVKVKAILDEIKPKIKEVRVKTNDEVMSLLTPEQKQKFQEIRKKYESPPKLGE